MSSSNNTNTSGREATELQLNISSRDAEALVRAGDGSHEKRGIATGPDSVRMYNAKEEEQMLAAADASKKNRGQHITGEIVDDYARNSGNSGGK
ncbi:hypothetical protein CC80DRAFT_496242 [Byssothecium circinans]|uniref:Uncharacterized protein n=1 Tax=Byssothecium circinans TaxID=147558 RepID=A0A6A5TQJ5_9PLEO|nr:hypothetical protein CC80DRAFT_496242 [Byssothecium circinans]